MPSLPLRQRGAAVVGEPHAGGRDADGEPVGLAGPGHDRVQAQAAGARLPARPRRVLPQRAVELEAGAAVAALEQHARVAARVERRRPPRRARSPRSARAPSSPPCGQRDAFGLLPLALGIVGVVDLRPVEGRGDRGAAGDRSAGRAARTRRARPRTRGAVTSNGAPGSPSSTNRPFLVPTSSSVIGVILPRSPGSTSTWSSAPTARVLRAELAVHEHVDVPPQQPALVEDPAARRRMLALEREQQIADRRALDRVLGAVAGEPLERPADAYDGHRMDPSQAGSPPICGPTRVTSGIGCSAHSGGSTPARSAAIRREVTLEAGRRADEQRSEPARRAVGERVRHAAGANASSPSRALISSSSTWNVSSPSAM